MATEGTKRKLADLRVVDLKQELEKRSFEKTGVKAALTDRLRKALTEEGHDPDTYEFLIVDASPARKTPLKKSKPDGEPELEDEEMDTEELTVEEEDKLLNDQSQSEPEMQVISTTAADGKAKMETEGDTREQQQLPSSNQEEKDPAPVSQVEEKSATQREEFPPAPQPVLTSADTIAMDTSLKKSEEDESLVVLVDDTEANFDYDLEQVSPSKRIKVDNGDANAASQPEQTEADSSSQDVKADTTAAVEAAKGDHKTDEGKSEGDKQAKKEDDKKSDVVKKDDKAKSSTSGKDGAKGKDDKDSKSRSSSGSNSRNLWVSGLSSTTRATDLKTLFSKHGKVVGAKIVTNAKSPGSRCYGFVTMSTPEEASKCIQHLHRTELHGRMISVERAKNDPASHSRGAHSAARRPHTNSTISSSKKAEEKKDDKDKANEAKKEVDKKEEKKDVARKDSRRDDRRRTTSRRDDRHDSRRSSGSGRGGSRKPSASSSSADKSKEGEKKEENKDKPKTDAASKADGEKTEAAEGKTETKPEIKTEDHKEGDKKKESDKKEGDKKKESDREGDKKKDDKKVVPFEKIKAEKEREEMRRRERQLRQIERRRQDTIRRERLKQREVERRQREEAMRLQRERERLRLEREALEKEKLEAEIRERERIRLERERRERERVEREREEQRRIQLLRLEEEQQRRAAKRPYDRAGPRTDPYWDNKRPAPDAGRFDSRGPAAAAAGYPDTRYNEFDQRGRGADDRQVAANIPDPYERRVERYDRRDDQAHTREARGARHNDPAAKTSQGRYSDNRKDTRDSRDVGRHNAPASRDKDDRHGADQRGGRGDHDNYGRFSDNRGQMRDSKQSTTQTSGRDLNRSRDSSHRDDTRHTDSRSEWKNERNVQNQQEDRRNVQSRYQDQNKGGRDSWRNDDRGGRNQTFGGNQQSSGTGRDTWRNDDRGGRNQGYSGNAQSSGVDSRGGDASVPFKTNQPAWTQSTLDPLRRAGDAAWPAVSAHGAVQPLVLAPGAFQVPQAGSMYLGAAAQAANLMLSAGALAQPRSQDAKFDAYKPMSSNTGRRY